MRRRSLVVGIIAAVLVLGLGAVAMSAGPFEQPAEGQQFLYFGPAEDGSDPDMPESTDNDVAHFDTTSGEPVGMFRRLGQPGSDAGEQVFELDNQLGVKYFLESPRQCGAGSPRIQLAVDEDGDGSPDGNLHGHIPDPPAYNNNCPNDKWVYVDLADDEPRWEIGPGLTGARAFPFYTWTEVEGFLGPAFVTEGMLIEDAQAFKGDNRGIAFYDLVSIGNRTFEDHNDSGERGNSVRP